MGAVGMCACAFQVAVGTYDIRMCIHVMYMPVEAKGQLQLYFPKR